MDEDGDGQAETEATLDDGAASDLFSDAELAEEAGWWADDGTEAADAPEADTPADPSADDEATPVDAGSDDASEADPEASSPDPETSGSGDEGGGDAADPGDGGDDGGG